MAKRTKRKVRKNVVRAIVHIKATFNNTLITITDLDGNTVCSGSSGCVGFKGSRKSTPFAAQRAAQRCASAAMRNGVRHLSPSASGIAYHLDRGRYPPSAQRLQAAEAKESLKNKIRNTKYETMKSTKHEIRILVFKL